MIKKIFTISITALFMGFTSEFSFAAQPAELSPRTPVLARAASDISEENHKAGDIVKFYSVYPVKDIYGNVVMTAGTPINAVITKLEKKKRIGRPASLSISSFSAVSYDGRPVYFNGVINRTSESRMARSIVLSVFMPFFLLMKGAGAELPAGSQVILHPSVDYQI